MPLEIEHKFLVRGEYKTLASSSTHIMQGYICSGKGRTVRVRVRDDKGYLTIKGPSLDGGLSRYEFEKEITLDEAKRLMSLCEPGIIDKRRYLVPFKGHVFEGFEKPDFIGRDVTGDRRFYNSSLRVNPFKDWKDMLPEYKK